MNSIPDQREYMILEEIAKTPEISQRSLSHKVDVSLGLVNTFLKRLIKKGMIKAHHIDGKKLAYVLTPKGIKEKAVLTYFYLEASLQHYKKARYLLTQTIERLARDGVQRIYIWGSVEWSEICFLTAQEHNLEVVGFIGGEPGLFLGRPRCAPEEVNDASAADTCIIAINQDRGALAADCSLPVVEVMNADFAGID